jgi:phage terminase large subunit-like protein
VAARPKQLPPDHPRHHEADAAGHRCGCDGADDRYNIWLLLCGRGFGKTLTGANWLVGQALEQPGSRWAVLAPTYRDTRVTCIEGETGILGVVPPGESVEYRRNYLQIHFANGSVIYGLSADQPERIRGSNLWGAWVDELGSWRYAQTWYEGLIPALRKGEHPRVVVTATPRPTGLIRDLLARDDGSVHVTRASTWENASNLAAPALAELRLRYEGTRLGRQELEGELLTDVPGALWQRDQIEADRVRPQDVPEMVRVVVSVDPAVTDGETSAETGIIVGGVARDGHGYVLADYTLRGTPQRAMRKIADAYHEFSADRVVAEVNNGGDYIGTLLHTVDENIPYRAVRATRGKHTRAEPISALYEQHRIHHVGSLPQLEDQLCSWLPTDPESPDRLDANVWLWTELRDMIYSGYSQAYGVVKCGKCPRSYLAMANGKPRDRCPHCGAPAEAE